MAIRGQQVECEDINCSRSKILGNEGDPVISSFSHFECQKDSCNSTSLNYSQFHRLEIDFSDKKRISNVFEAINGEEFFDVKINSDGNLTVKKNNIYYFKEAFSEAIFFIFHYPSMYSFLIWFLSAILLEIVIAGIFFKIKKIPRLYLRYVIYENFISIPIFWILCGQNNSSYIVLFDEIIITLFEGAFLMFFIKQLNWRSAIAISVAMNLASFFLGSFFGSVILSYLL
jgi:hypothetical protein